MVRLSPHRARNDIIKNIKNASTLEEKEAIVSTELVFVLSGKNKKFDEERTFVFLEGLDSEFNGDEDLEEERYKEWSRQYDRDLDKMRDQQHDRDLDRIRDQDRDRARR